MGKYIDADRLKAEINKRKKSLRAGICGEAFTRKQKYEMLVASEELDRFNRIIDSLQKEQPCEDLDEAAENYIAPIENDEGLDYINFNGRDIKDAFIAGAQWRDAQIPKLPDDVDEAAVAYSKQVSDGHNYRDLRVGFKAGAEWALKQK